MEQRTIRAFVAVPLPEETKALLGQVQGQLRRTTGESMVRWVAPEGLHLTLKFLGTIQTSLVPAVARALDEVAGTAEPSTLFLSTLGAFPNPRRPRVVWVGLEGEVEKLEEVYRALEQALATLKFPPERRPLSPHITLGRVREGATPAEQERLAESLRQVTGTAGAPPIPAKELILYQSTLTPQGAIYSSLAVAPLGPAGPTQPS